jgi:hypothetical protein
MTDLESQLESRLNSTTQFTEVDDNIPPLQSYYAIEAIPAEMCKLLCFCIMMIIAIGFIIAAAMCGCIYNCKN